MSARDELRAKIFAEENRKQKVVPLTFFGVEMELRQPTFAQTLDLRDDAGGDEQNTAILILLNFAYVPGTNEKVFDPADYDQLVSMPMGRDMQDAITAVRRLTETFVDEGTLNQAGGLPTNPN